MATTKQKKAARKNLEKARASGTKRRKDATSSKGNQLSTADKNDLPKKVFAFPKERKEPLNDAKHVRNAIARFDQVEGVSDAERDEAWKRIKKAAEKHDIEIEAKSWRDLMKSGKAKKATRKRSAKKASSTKRRTKSKK
jgi:hypothetical protein